MGSLIICAGIITLIVINAFCNRYASFTSAATGWSLYLHYNGAGHVMNPGDLDQTLIFFALAAGLCIDGIIWRWFRRKKE